MFCIGRWNGTLVHLIIVAMNGTNISIAKLESMQSSLPLICDIIPLSDQARVLTASGMVILFRTPIAAVKTPMICI